MSKKFATVMLLAGVALALTSVAIGSNEATKMSVKASLNVGQAKPAPKHTKNGASGKFTATLNGTKLTWKLTFSHLSGPATAAHIHAGRRGVSNPAPLIPLCGPCSSGQSGTATVTSAQIAQIKAGATYVNVHTTLNAAGEIRGQVVPAK
jgi:CHRD domain-containing protein